MDKLTRYDSVDFFYIWKPHDIPSVRGFRLSMFEILENYLQTHDDDLTTLLKLNQTIFGLESEWGLCNRLDVPTAGLLYFAKSKAIYDQYRSAQRDGMLIKYYVGTITGRLHTNKIIARNIAHHTHLDDRMITAHTCKPPQTKGRRQYGWTELCPLSYDPEMNRTHVSITICGGVRHQIRIHCASIGSPLVGETLYGTSKNRQSDEVLHLWSVGHNYIL